MILAPFVALASAAAYGTGDFYGGVAAARLRVAPAALITYGLAGATALVGLLFAGGTWTGAAVGWSLLAGLFAILGSLAFFAALVSGPMSLGAPIVGTLESAVPVLATVVIGQRLTGRTWLAVVLAVVAGVLVVLRRGAGERMSARAGVFAVIGGLAFGTSILSLNRAPHGSGLIPAVFQGAVGFVVMSVLLVVARRAPALGRLLGRLDVEAVATDARPGPARQAGRRTLLPALASGVLLGLGNVLLVVALRLGSLAVVTVLADLYPVATVLLAWVVVRERLAPLQLGGVALAVAATALFAAS